MKVISEVIQFIMNEEHFMASAYKDPGGIWTIGYGCTTNVKEGDTCTPDEAKVMFLRDLTECAKSVIRELKKNLNDNQFSACVSLAYNIGVGNFSQSTLLKLIQAENWKEAADEFLRWDHIGKVEYAGLKERREKEREIFLRPC